MSAVPAPEPKVSVTRKDIAMAAIIGVFILVGITVASGAWGCTNSCPTFSQEHFDRFVELIYIIGISGITYLGLRANGNIKT